jgi:nicotinamidase-related amidase
MVTTLLLIDVQKDFHPGGNLEIPSANEDAERIADLIRDHGDKIDRIVATMDSHHKLHIAHPCFWVSERRTHPNPFTIISSKDIETGKWRPRSDFKLPDNVSLLDSVFDSLARVTASDGTLDLTNYCIEYTRRLEAKGRFQLCVWPEHCLIGSDGHGIVENVFHSIEEWSARYGRSVEWILKGQNLLTEMYSALEAEVPISAETSFNHSLLESLLSSDSLLVCGQAKSHCVNFTLRDIVDHWPEKKRSLIRLLTNCASAVPGFEDAAIQFQRDMSEAGVQLVTSADAFRQ